MAIPTNGRSNEILCAIQTPLADERAAAEAMTEQPVAAVELEVSVRDAAAAERIKRRGREKMKLATGR